MLLMGGTNQLNKSELATAARATSNAISNRFEFNNTLEFHTFSEQHIVHERLSSLCRTRVKGDHEASEAARGSARQAIVSNLAT